MDKIKISKISKNAFLQKGFSGGAFEGCFNCPCGPDAKGGACCRYGCDVDGTSYELLLKNRKIVEETIGRTLEDCFEGKQVKDADYLGGQYIKSKVDPKNGYCVFHNKTGKGCELVRLILEKNLPPRILPAICRLYPLTWDNGELFTYDEKLGDIEKNCDCVRAGNTTKKSIIHTQKEELSDIFEFEGDAKKDLEEFLGKPLN